MKRIVEISEWINGKASPVGRLTIDDCQFSEPIEDALDSIVNGDDGSIADLLNYAEASTLPEDYEFGGGDVYEVVE